MQGLKRERMLGSILSIEKVKNQKFTLIFDNALNFARQFFQGWHKNGVQLLSEIDIVVLLAVRQGYNLVLETEQAFAEGNVEVVAEHVHIFGLGAVFLVTLRFFINLNNRLAALLNLHLPSL